MAEKQQQQQQGRSFLMLAKSVTETNNSTV